jgi:hypothetical protein
MPTQDQLEIIRASGEVEFYDLDPARGITNIGRHPENDIVIDSPGVAPFHAVLDYRQRPYQLVVLSEEGETKLDGQPLPAHISREVRNWGTVEFNGHAIILLEGEAGAARPVPTAAPVPVPQPLPEVPVPIPVPVAVPAAPPVPRRPEGPPTRRRLVGPSVPPPDQSDEVIVSELSQREWTINVEQTATYQATIVNGGAIVAMFEVRVDGLPEDWVVISPPHVNLYEGERAMVTITITPPRLPSSRAGAHHFAVVVTSPNYPGRSSQRGATLTINPYYEFTVGELSPRQQSISWFKRSGRTTIPIMSKGNSDTTFRLEGTDDERACNFEFQVPGETVSLAMQAETCLSPQEAVTIPVSITPRTRRLIGLRKHTYSFAITTTMLEGGQTPRTVLGQLGSSPLIGFWHMLLTFILLAITVVFLFMPGSEPRLYSDEGQRLSATNNKLTLHYNVSRFKSLGPSNIFNIINGITLDVKVERKLARAADNTYEVVKASLRGPTGTVGDAPTKDVVYRLTVGNWLTLLLPALARSTTYDVAILPVLPIIEVSPQQAQVILGQSVTLSWKVQYADRLVIETKDGIAIKAIDSPEPTGSLDVKPENDTIYIFNASNLYTGDSPEKGTAAVRVIIPPPPPPVIVFFSAQPNQVVQGTPVAFNWEVSGADTVSFESDDPTDRPFPVGPAGPPISRQPTRTTLYSLRAAKGSATAVAYQQVSVAPPPTATPTPSAPEIRYFTAYPDTLVLGDESLTTLRWTVVGTTTNVEISGPSLASPIANLKQDDAISVTVKDSTLFVLTAYNQDKKNSQNVQVAVETPTPTPTVTPPPPPPPTPIPPPKIFFFKLEPNNPADASKVKSLGGNPPRYQVLVGTDVKLSWDVSTDAEKVTLNPGSNPFGPGANSLQVVNFSGLNPSSYQLIAQGAGGSTQQSLQIQVLPNPPPKPPSSVSGVVNGDDNKITWVWTGSEQISGFRVYRADVPPGDNFVAAQTVDKDKFEWTDAGAGCGKVYYVVTLYKDVKLKDQETAPSGTSWASNACP